MKTLTATLAATATLTFVLGGCAVTKEEVVEENIEARETAKAYIDQEADKAQMKLEKRLTKAEEQIAALQDLRHEDETLSALMKDDIDRIQAKADWLRLKLDAMEDVENDLKSEANMDAAEFRAELNKLFADIDALNAEVDS